MLTRRQTRLMTHEAPRKNTQKNSNGPPCRAPQPPHKLLPRPRPRPTRDRRLSPLLRPGPRLHSVLHAQPGRWLDMLRKLGEQFDRNLPQPPHHQVRQDHVGQAVAGQAPCGHLVELPLLQERLRGACKGVGGRQGGGRRASAKGAPCCAGARGLRHHGRLRRGLLWTRIPGSCGGGF